MVKNKKTNIRKKYIILGIILIVIAIFLFFILKNDYSATLKEYNGFIEINRKGNILSPELNMELKKNDVIITGEASSAYIVINNSVFLSLEENTEISIESLTKNVKIKQNSGTTWNKFLNLVGITNFEINTPNAIATIRGTDFGIDLSNEKELFLLLEGNLEVNVNGEIEKLNNYSKLLLNDDGTYNLSELTQEEIDYALSKMKKHIDIIKDMRLQEVYSKKKVVNKLIDLLNNDEEKIDFDRDVLTFFEDIDSGKVNDRELVNKLPYKPSFIDRIIIMNDAIKEANVIIDNVEGNNEQNNNENIDENKEIIEEEIKEPEEKPEEEPSENDTETSDTSSSSSSSSSTSTSTSTDDKTDYKTNDSTSNVSTSTNNTVYKQRI